MPRLMKTSLLMLLILLVMTPPAWSAEVGQPIPDFSIETFSSGNASRAALEGKPVLIVFWNTWCPDCMRELPEISRLAERYGPKGLAVLAVNTAMNDKEGKARAYWEKKGYKFPSAFDQYFDVGQAFGVRGVPTILLVDSGGVVRYRQARVPADMEERFSQLTVKGQP